MSLRRDNYYPSTWLNIISNSIVDVGSCWQRRRLLLWKLWNVVCSCGARKEGRGAQSGDAEVESGGVLVISRWPCKEMRHASHREVSTGCARARTPQDQKVTRPLFFQNYGGSATRLPTLLWAVLLFSRSRSYIYKLMEFKKLANNRKIYISNDYE